MPHKILAPWGDDDTLLGHILDECVKVHAQRYTLATDHDSAWGLRPYNHWPYDMFPGSSEDVLGRFLAASSEDDTWIMRVCGDSPFISAALMNHLINNIEEIAGVYPDLIVMNDIPNGMCGELIYRPSLLELYKTATDEEKEHVTLGLFNRGKNGIIKWTNPPKLSIDTESEYLYLRSLL